MDALRGQFGDLASLRSVRAIDGQVKRTGPRNYRLTLSAEIEARTALRTLSAPGCDELVSAAVWLLGLAVGRAPVEARASGREPVEASSDTPPGSGAQRELTGGASATAQARPSDREHGQAPEGVSEKAAAKTGDPVSPESSAVQVATPEQDKPQDAPGAALSATVRTRRRPTLHARVAAFGGLYAGAGAKVQAAFGVWASISADFLHTQIYAIDLLPADQGTAGGRHVQVSSVALGVSECALWGQRLRAGPCVGIEGLRTAAHSKDFGADIHRAVFWGVLQVGLQFIWPLTRWLDLTLSGGAGTPITPRPRFTVTGVGPVAEASRWSEEARIGVIYVAR
jgi:hypothetical protein